MAGSQYLYQVAVDTGSTLRAAANVRQVFQREMSQVTTGLGGTLSRFTGGDLATSLTSGLSRGLSKGLLAGLSGGLAGGVAGLVAGISVGAVTQTAGEMARLNAQAQSSERALTALAGGADVAEQRIAAVQQASGGAATRLEAMRIANQGAVLGFGKTSAELARVTTLASKVSTVGGDLAGNIENMAAAAANLSFVRLDTLGIPADQTRKRFEELRGELGDTAAFMQAMLEVGEKTFAAIDPDPSGVTQLTAAMADLRVEIAAITGPIADSAAGGTAGFVRGLTAEINDLRDGTTVAEVKLAALTAVLRGFEYGLEKVKEKRAAGLADNGDVEEMEHKVAVLSATVDHLANNLDEINGASIEDVGSAADSALPKIQNLTDETERFKNLVSEISGANFAPRFSPSYTGYDNPPSMRAGQSNVDSMMEQLRLNTEEQRRQLIDEGRHNEELGREQSRLAKQTAADTSRSWSNAADAVEKAWKDAAGGVSGIPGVTGRSEVTQLDMDLAKYGLYQPKPDEYLRQVEDQLLNGVDRGINRSLIEQLTSQSTGFDLGKVGALPNDLFAQLFGQEYSSGRLFATPMGQEMAGTLFNTGAVGRGIDQQQAGQAGGDFIKKLLGENLPEQFASVAGEALKGLRDGIINSDDLGNIGQQAMDNLLSAFTSRTSTSPQVEAAANSLIAEFFRRYQEALNGGT